MDKFHLKWRVNISIGLTGLCLIGFEAAVVIIAVNRNTPVVLIPFAIATLISCGAVWWAQHGIGELGVSPPFGAEKITQYSSAARLAKAVDCDQQR